MSIAIVGECGEGIGRVLPRRAVALGGRVQDRGGEPGTAGGRETTESASRLWGRGFPRPYPWIPTCRTPAG
ncbi:MAG: hypothetical protein HY717_07495 [Planctomycetes bacterium]|nr:hypothetical protein [Planctomycetota bacterium]